MQVVTNHKGQIHERLEYTPYGELWIEHLSNDAPEDTTPFRFTGKELDPETGFYYYGARYLEPKTSRWISGDPAMADYLPSAPVNDEARKRNGNLPGMGGVFNYVNLHCYHYAGNNPILYTDPDGRDLNIIVSKSSNTLIATYSPNKDYSNPQYPNVNNYNKTVSVTYNVVTNVVRNNPDNNVKSDINRTQSSGINKEPTNPTQIANGTYDISLAVSPSAGINPSPYYKYGEPGNGLLIDVTQMLANINTGELVADSGYMIHITSNNYTDGCIGLPYDPSVTGSRQTAESKMDRLVQLFLIAKLRNESATITITD